MSALPKLVIIGGTGAQGVPAVKALSEAGRHEIVVLTRDPVSDQARVLSALPQVSLFKGTYTYEPDVWALFKGAHAAYVNTDGFVIGEKAEIFWGMRIFEIAVAQGVKHYVWGSIRYLSKIGGFDPQYRSGHMDAKGRVSEWLLAQKLEEVTVTVFTTAPYMNMFWDDQLGPEKNEDGSFTFYSSIGDGTIPLIALEDIGPNVRWIFENRARADNLILTAITDILPYSAIVSAFEKVTGKKGHWCDLPYDEFARLHGWTDDIPASWAMVPGTSADPTGLSIKENFRGFWNSWRDNFFKWSDVNIVLLDEINPNRLKSFEEWLVACKYDGERKIVLKDAADVGARMAMARGQDPSSY